MTREEALVALRESLTEAEELIADGIDSNADDALVSVSVSTARALLSPSEREEKLEAALRQALDRMERVERMPLGGRIPACSAAIVQAHAALAKGGGDE